MWALENTTPYAAGSAWLRDKQGRHHWLVAVKATFTFSASGRVALADEQPEPLLEPRYSGDPASTCLVCDSDLLYARSTTDVIVEACAHAPGGRPAASVPVAIRVGGVEKHLLVHGVRVYYRGALGMAVTAARPFEKRAITYEAAWGGSDLQDKDPRRQRIDLRNPLGRGVAVDPRRLENQEAHAIEYPGKDAAKAGPAGFGAIPPSWSPRLQRAGTYDDRWTRSKKPLLPDDYDERFAQSAPDDQRPPAPLEGGEPVVLVNLTQEGTVRFALPRLALRFTSRIHSRVEERPGLLATVFIDAEARALSLVWQSAVMVSAHEVDYLDGTRIVERPS